MEGAAFAARRGLLLRPHEWSSAHHRGIFKGDCTTKRVPVNGLRLPPLNHLRFILIKLFSVFRRTCPGERPFSSGSTERHGQLHPYIEVAVVQPYAPQKRLGTLSLKVRLCRGGSSHLHSTGCRLLNVEIAFGDGKHVPTSPLL